MLNTKIPACHIYYCSQSRNLHYTTKKRFTHTHTPVYICTALHIDFIIIQSVYYRRGRFQFRSRFLFLLFDFSLSLSISSWLHSIHFCRVHLHSNWPVLMRCMPNVLLISNSVFKSFSRSYYLRMEVNIHSCECSNKQNGPRKQKSEQKLDSNQTQTRREWFDVESTARRFSFCLCLLIR